MVYQKHLARLALILVGSSLIFTVMGATPVGFNTAAAQEEGRQFSAKAGEIVNAANAFIKKEQHSAALSKLNEAIALPESNPFERSTIYQMMGTSYYEQKQYGPAIDAFEKAIKAGGFLPEEVASLRVNISQLLFINGAPAAGAQMLEEYVNQSGQRKPEYIEMLVQAWIQAEDYAKALPWAELWFNQATPKGRKHFDLMNFLYNNLSMTSEQADVIKEMINRWPNDAALWEAWTSMLADSGRELDAFEIVKMRYISGALNTEADILKVVQYYSFYDMPYQAARILDAEMKNGRVTRSSDKLVQLSSFYRQAREYKMAIPILEEAAASSGQAKIYADLGEALYNEGQCSKSETAFREAMNRGYDAGKSWMLIATCRYEATQNLGRLKCDMTNEQVENAPVTLARLSAIEAYETVPTSSRESRNAQKWIKFIGEEMTSFQGKCDFMKKVQEERCHIEIKGAYAEIIFTTDLNISEECLPHKASYDLKYRPNSTGS